jgi:hypothetical protein
MKYRDCIIAWTPLSWPDHNTAGMVEVGPHPDRTGGSDKYAMTIGACWLARWTMPHWQQVALMLTDFHQIVVRDGIDPQVAHRAFLAIDEYRRVISPDIDGAEDGSDG